MENKLCIYSCLNTGIGMRVLYMYVCFFEILQKPSEAAVTLAFLKQDEIYGYHCEEIGGVE